MHTAGSSVSLLLGSLLILTGCGGGGSRADAGSSPDTRAGDAPAASPDVGARGDGSGADAGTVPTDAPAPRDGVTTPDSPAGPPGDTRAADIGPANDGGARDAAAPETGAGPVDSGPPVSGGPGCGAGSLCLNLRNAYGEALMRARSCSPGASGTCGLKARGNLGCGGCEVWVNDTTELDALAARFKQANCEMCFYGSPTGDRCHPTICPELHNGMCTPQGSCTDFEAPCPPGVVQGGPCTSGTPSCRIGPNRSCLCISMKWMCF